MPETGALAPDFDLPDQHGQRVRLSDRGTAVVLLVFYPFAFSRVCSGELSELRDGLSRFTDRNVVVLGVSCDHMFAQRAFADADGIDFALLSDYWPHGGVARAYDSFDEEIGCARRSTFVIDKQGVLRWSVSSDMSRARDLDEYERVIGALEDGHDVA